MKTKQLFIIFNKEFNNRDKIQIICDEESLTVLDTDKDIILQQYKLSDGEVIYYEDYKGSWYDNSKLDFPFLSIIHDIPLWGSIFELNKTELTHEDRMIATIRDEWYNAAMLTETLRAGLAPMVYETNSDKSYSFISTKTILGITLIVLEVQNSSKLKKWTEPRISKNPPALKHK